jgi:hypothetical protein
VKQFLHINSNGYVLGTALGDRAPRPLPGCTVTEYDEAIPAAPERGEHILYHLARAAWEDIRPLNALKLAKWAEIKAERERREYGTFTASTGQTIDIDQASQTRLQSVYNLAVDAKASNTDFSIDWTLSDNSVVTLNANQVIALGKQVYQHIGTLHTTARQLRNQILAATTAEQARAIQWP